jgi:L-amino acid N-acyltransferase YncA
MKDLRIRLANPDDAEAALEVYRPYVLETAITFEYGEPSLEEFRHRIESTIKDYPWLLCVEDDKVIGYAYANKHRYKTAYQWSPESTIYLSEGYHGRGIARLLYETLFEMLKLQGFYNVYAGVGMPNEKSEGLHKALGFDEIGVFRHVGYKLGAWHSTKWFQKHLSEHVLEPSTPKTMEEVKGSEAFKTILEYANNKLK